MSNQGCVISALLLNIAIDLVLSRNVEDRRGIRWTLSIALEDLDCGNCASLLSHCFNDMQRNSGRLSRFTRQVGLKISPNEKEVLPVNISAALPLKIDSYTLQRPSTSPIWGVQSVVKAAPPRIFDRDLVELEEIMTCVEK